MQKQRSPGSIYTSTGNIKNTYPSTFGSYIKDLLVQTYWQLISTKQLWSVSNCRIHLSTFWLPWCDVCYDFHIKTMFGSFSLPVVCRIARVLFHKNWGELGYSGRPKGKLKWHPSCSSSYKPNDKCMFVHACVYYVYSFWCLRYVFVWV